MSTHLLPTIGSQRLDKGWPIGHIQAIHPGNQVCSTAHTQTQTQYVVDVDDGDYLNGYRLLSYLSTYLQQSSLGRG